MNTKDKIIEKLKKIAALAEQGVGGEKTNAVIILERLLKKHDLTWEDLKDEDKTAIYYFTYKNRWEKSILFACADRATNGIKTYRQVRSRNKLGLEMTPIQNIEFCCLWEYYKRLWRKEIKRMTTAFVLKHHLYIDSSEEDDDKSRNKLSAEEIEKIRIMIYGLSESKYIGPKRMITGDVK